METGANLQTHEHLLLLVAPVPFIIITRATAAARKFGAVVPWPGIPCHQSFVDSRQRIRNCV